MQLELTRIGNSRGIRIPKPLISQCGLGDIVELHVTPQGLIISPHRAPRQDWQGAFSKSTPVEREMLLDASANEFDALEWKW
ncbi:MAG: AbrB/MazE/SpoVT family DNA-binding domain-containing protein [Candidatus Sulfotelmatobacter sp.]